MTDNEQKLLKLLQSAARGFGSMHNAETDKNFAFTSSFKELREAMTIVETMQPTPAPDVQAEAERLYQHFKPGREAEEIRREAERLAKELGFANRLNELLTEGYTPTAVDKIAASLQSMLERGKRHISNISTFGEPITDAELRHVELLIMEPLLNDEDPKKGTRLLCGLVERLRVAEKELAKHRPSQDGGNR